MIRDIADILNGLMVEERNKLDQYHLTHPPTIGRMYEGLTTEILKKSIPSRLNLQIRSGFIHSGTDDLSDEIDCMLVSGTGERVPFTESYKWHVKDVIAVFEVKKTLYSNDLKDAFCHLRGILDNYGRYVQSGKSDKKYDLSNALKAFSETTGLMVSSREQINALSFEKQIIHHTLITEHLSPIRIVLGFHGFKTEASFRTAVLKFLNENLEVHGFGVGSFPQLIISGKYSLIKMNGQPYSAPMQSDFWDFYGSSRSNPVLLILELIWTRLANEFGLQGLWGDDLQVENFAPFISGRINQFGERFGWEYNFTKIGTAALAKLEPEDSWEPLYVTNAQFCAFNILCTEEYINIKDADFIEFLQKENETPDKFIEELTSTGLVALEGECLCLTTECCQCGVLPNGQFFVADCKMPRKNLLLFKGRWWSRCSLQ
ncbi:MAG: DUF6602 domain-containing protein [Pedobacter sp.]